jgi:hypothetical protein
MVPAASTDRAHGWCSLSPIVTAVLLLSVSLACSTQRVPARAPEPLRPPSDTAPSQAVSLVRFREDSARYVIEAFVITRELLPGTTRDSSSFREEIGARVFVQSDSSAELILEAGRGGFRNTSDSVSRGATQISPSRTPLPIVRFGLGQREAVQLSRDTSVVCPSFPTLLTPLLSRLIVLASLPNPFPRPDTLSYTACLADVSISSRYIVQPRSHGDVRSGDHHADIIGELQSDSTRFLPMRLGGSVRGSLVLFKEFTPALPQQLELQLSADLLFTSSIRQQQLQQETRLTIRRRVQ